MATADTYVPAQPIGFTKQRASDALAAMGLSMSDAICLLMIRIADKDRLPFEVKVPNATTLAGIQELEAGKGMRVADIKALMANLNAVD